MTHSLQTQRHTQSYFCHLIDTVGMSTKMLVSPTFFFPFLFGMFVLQKKTSLKEDNNYNKKRIFFFKEERKA
jgi:hypothetical protein